MIDRESLKIKGLVKDIKKTHAKSKNVNINKTIIKLEAQNHVIWMEHKIQNKNVAALNQIVDDAK